VIVAPHITEKSTLVSEHNAGCVQGRRRRHQARDQGRRRGAVLVKVTGVNTIVQKGKTKKWKGAPYKQLDVKKAIVTLADGQSIDVTSGNQIGEWHSSIITRRRRPASA
jgi:large subunit ribosomal protein L23